MGLAVETPTPPDLTNRPLPSSLDPEDVLDSTTDLRRAELEEVLLDGAWSEAFQEWTEYTDLTEGEFRIIRDAGVFEGLDFYWDAGEGNVRFEIPDLPRAVTRHENLDSLAASELTDLARIVTEVLEETYVDWGDHGTDEDGSSEDAYTDETSFED